jgi:hypothetical protein
MRDTLSEPARRRVRHSRGGQATVRRREAFGAFPADPRIRSDRIRKDPSALLLLLSVDATNP